MKLVDNQHGERTSSPTPLARPQTEGEGEEGRWAQSPHVQRRQSAFLM